MNKVYDLIVIGAGPSGSTTAFKSAEMGIEVLLMDKCQFPREKVCGGYLSAKTLDLLGSRFLQEVVEQEIFGVRLYDRFLNNMEKKTAPLLGVTVQRKQFDYMLLKQALSAGVLFNEKCEAIGLGEKSNSDIIEINTTKGIYKARRVVEADGVNCSWGLRSGIIKKLHRWQMGFTLSAFVETSFTGEEAQRNAFVELYCIPLPGGFGWCFPMQNGFNVGVGCWAGSTKSLRNYSANFIREVCELKGVSSREIRLKGSYIPAGGFPRNKGKGNIVFAGDAGGFVDPFSGEGIYYAVRSGEIAAEEALRSLYDDEKSFAVNFADRCKREFTKQFRESLYYTIINGRKKRISSFNKAGEKIADNIIEIMRSPYPYRSIIMPFHHKR